MPTPRTPRAGRCTDWTVVDRIIDSYLQRGVRPTSDRLHAAGALQRTGRHALPAQLAPGLWLPADRSSLERAAQDYARSGRSWSTSGCALRGALGPRRVNLVLRGLERTQPPALLERHAGRVQPTARPRHGGRAPRAARGARGWARRGQPRRRLHGRLLQHVVSGKNHATGEIGTPTDFLSFHAKGSPRFVDGHVRMGMAVQLKDIATGFQKIAAVPELKGKPIVIGENDPEGCAACPARRTPTATARCTRATRRPLQAHLAAGRAPWRQPGRRADLGLHL